MDPLPESSSCGHISQSADEMQSQQKNSVSCNEQENVQIVEAEEVSLPEDVMPSSSRVIEDYETDRMGRTFLSE